LQPIHYHHVTAVNY